MFADDCCDTLYTLYDQKNGVYKMAKENLLAVDRNVYGLRKLIVIDTSFFSSRQAPHVKHQTMFRSTA